VGVDDLDRKGHLGVRISYQILADAINVFGDFRIGNQLRRGLHLLGVVATHLDLLFETVPIAQPAVASHLTISDRIQITNAAVMICFSSFGDGLDAGGRSNWRSGWVRKRFVLRNRQSPEQKQETHDHRDNWTMHEPTTTGDFYTFPGKKVAENLTVPPA